MSIASEILRLQNASAAIASAIAAKGVTVPAGSGFDDYASLIASIETGGGGGGGGGAHTLPSGYTELSYIENPLGNSAYINLGLQINYTPGFDLDFMSYDDIGIDNYGCIIGARQASLNSDFQLTSYTGNTYSGSLRLGNNNNNAHLPAKNTRFTASLRNAVYTMNSTSYNYSRSSSTYNYNWFLFALNQQGNAIQNGHGRVYSLKLYIVGSLVRDMVPCKNPNNVVGLYDLVSEAFFGSANASTFTAGPTI